MIIRTWIYQIVSMRKYGETQVALDTIEDNLALWFDASKIDYASNATLSDGDAITEVERFEWEWSCDYAVRYK